MSLNEREFAYLSVTHFASSKWCLSFEYKGIYDDSRNASWLMENELMGHCFHILRLLYSIQQI